MTRHGLPMVLAVFLVCGGVLADATAAQFRAGPDFREVYELIRTNAAGISEPDLNRAAVQGLVEQLGTKVSIVGEDNPEEARSTEAALTRVEVLSDDLGYLRIGRVSNGLAEAIRSRFEELQRTNKVIGIVLDLRYATGTDYRAAVAVADLFFSKAVPLMDFGSGVVSAQPKENAISVPVAILVNSQTAGAAEALAATLRANGTGLILGSQSAGEAMITRDFELSNGDRLRIATAPVTLGDGSRIPLDGIKPDISVAVAADIERAYYADSFYVAAETNAVAGVDGSRTNTAAGGRRTRLNEAELVREHREGSFRLTNAAPQLEELERPVVSDPALARALDLLKGLAVVRQSRS